MHRPGVALGRWDRIFPSVYILAGAPLNWHARLIAACLWAGPVAAASHESAALLWQLPGFTGRPLVISTTRQVRSPLLTVRNRARLHAGDIELVEQVPTTNIERTLVDVAATQPEPLLEAVVDDAFFRRLSNPRKLHAYCDEYPELSGIRPLQNLLDERGNVPPNQTILETFTTRVVRAFSLPEPQRQVPIYDGAEVIKRIDLCYRRYQVIIEPDGGRWHAGAGARARDADVRNRLQALGWIVLVVTWRGVTREPHKVARTVLAALRSRGYKG